MKKLLIVLICILFFTLNSFGGPTYTGSGGLADGTGTDDQTAAEVVVTPAGDIAAIEVQTALEELDGEKMSTGTDTLTSAELLDTVSDETGTGAAVFGTAPTFTTSITIGTNVITEAEAGYLEDVTSSVQDQLDLKAPLASPTFTGTVTIPNDQIKSAMIDWNDIGNLGDDGIATDFALTVDADVGDYDIHSVDGLYGASDTEYIDMGGDLVTIVSDTLVSIYSPDLRFGVDADAYLKIVTTDGGITTISQVSDGTDGITLGDGTDNIIISGDNWSVDTSGNATFAGTISAAANSTPWYTFLDDDCLGTDKDIARIGGNAVTTTDGAEDGDLYLQSMEAGEINTTRARFDQANARWDMQAYNLVTTGKIMGGVNVSSKAGAYTIGTDDAKEAYGTLFTNSNVADLTLPATPVVGMSGCLMQEAGVTGIMKLQPEGTENLVYEGVEKTAGTDLASAGAATDRICWVAITTDHWLITSSVGTWAE